MRVVRNIVSGVAAVALAAMFVFAGFAACLVPPVTHGLSSMFASDDISPLDRNQLVRVADATRDYSFGSHDLLALYRTIYEVDAEYRQSVGYSAASTTSAGFPRLDAVTDDTSLAQMKEAFRGASELYCFSEETISHLDDCHKLASLGFSWGIAFAILAVAGLVFTGITCGKRRLGGVCVGAGIGLLVLFAALGIWAFVDFDGFFAAFHGLFFKQGSWTFPYDSLLICSLPTAFWMGMGVVWLAVSALLSILSVVVGFKLRKR